jgi:hypothetical protein
VAITAFVFVAVEGYGIYEIIRRNANFVAIAFAFSFGVGRRGRQYGKNNYCEDLNHRVPFTLSNFSSVA